MEALWPAASWLTVSEVLDAINARADRTLAYSTIKTILTNLNDKGFLRRRAAGRAYEYTPARSRSDAERDAVRRVVRPLLGRGNPLLAHIVDEVGNDEESLLELERLLHAKRGAVKI